jgi:hypothetical protein
MGLCRFWQPRATAPAALGSLPHGEVNLGLPRTPIARVEACLPREYIAKAANGITAAGNPAIVQLERPKG